MDISREEAIDWLNNYAAHRRTICEIFREIYDRVVVMDDGEVKDSLEDLVIQGFIFGKKMNERLCFYNEEWQKAGHSFDPKLKELLSPPKNKNKKENRDKRQNRK